MPKVSYRIFKRAKEGRNLYYLNLVNLNEKDDIVSVGKNIMTITALDDASAKKDFEWHFNAMKLATYESFEEYGKFEFSEDKNDSTIWESELDPFDTNKDKILDGI